MNQKNQIFRVAIATPLRRSFDYLAPGSDRDMSFNFEPERTHIKIEIGMRVSVPFRQQLVVGIVTAVNCESTVPRHKLRLIDSILDSNPLLNTQDLKLLQWASDYYLHPIGEVIHSSIPALLRQGKAADRATQNFWSLTELGQKQLGKDATSLTRSPRQRQIVQMLSDKKLTLTVECENYHTDHVSSAVLGLTEQFFKNQNQISSWRETLKRLIKKQWVRETLIQCDTHNSVVLTDNHDAPHEKIPQRLNDAQQNAIDQIQMQLERQQYAAFLLYGVTGSGKTEVYLQASQHCLSNQQQVLILVPEIGLTPQLVSRFQQRLKVSVATSHSGLNDSERLNAWLAFRNGSADILIGTRSAVFTPMARPGLIIIDEEHDLSLKQQDGFRYSARDIAIIRARNLSIPIVMGSATPSLESLFNVDQTRFKLLELPDRAGLAIEPKISIIDIRHLKMQQSLSSILIERMLEHLSRGKQVLLFLNRRGYSPVLMCHDCGWSAICMRCDKQMTIHLSDNRMRCHHCGSERPIDTTCVTCKSQNLLKIGHGTQRIEEFLQQYFADYSIVRIDRDNTRRKGSLDKIFNAIHQQKHQILLGTQIIAKGHHFPNVTLVGIIDIDQGLFSADFRASERMAQLILQVAGRAGRAEDPGEVLIQTHHPKHELLQTLIRQGYAKFSTTLLTERQETQFPPYTHLALIRAEASTQSPPQQFLSQALQQLKHASDIECYGPFPAPMERRAGKFRYQLIIQALQRKTLHQCLAPLILQLENSSNNKIRWSIDIDPMEMF